MKRLLALSTVLVLVLSTLVSAQSGLTGSWQETTPSGLDARLELTATDAKVTGTLTVRGRTLTITDGQAAKNGFTFKAQLAEQPEGFSGELAGDEITLWRDRNGRGDAITLKRVPASLSGRWEGQTKNGFNVAFDFVVKQEVLTGTLFREGEPATISSGKVANDRFTFNATMGDQTEAFTGQFAGDQMKVWMDRQGPDMAATLKRVKK